MKLHYKIRINQAIYKRKENINVNECEGTVNLHR